MNLTDLGVKRGTSRLGKLTDFGRKELKKILKDTIFCLGIRMQSNFAILLQFTENLTDNKESGDYELKNSETIFF